MDFRSEEESSGNNRIPSFLSVSLGPVSQVSAPSRLCANAIFAFLFGAIWFCILFLVHDFHTCRQCDGTVTEGRLERKLSWILFIFESVTTIMTRATNLLRIMSGWLCCSVRHTLTSSYPEVWVSGLFRTMRFNSFFKNIRQPYSNTKSFKLETVLNATESVLRNRNHRNRNLITEPEP